MRKFCQNLQNAQLFRPKTGSLPLFLPSAAGQNSDTFSILHTVERGELLQGRENFRKYPFRLAATRQATFPKGTAKPSQSRLTPCQLPRRGSFSATSGKYSKTSPFGGGGFAKQRRRGFSPLALSRSLSCSAALSQKAALQMPFSVTTPPVKMRLERPAGRDKREIINNSSAIDVQSKAEHILNRPPIGVQRLFFLHRNVLLIMVY